ncbi:hypothetical protein AQUCO_02700204v1 [Aquilegia coerulea]|uniref:Peptidase A1 domain-containing protein n=1 Tax=Aquilegia coerulea TaxID=218851 RepID=A0A2G5D5S6_AQUCA|nr:hypothetical protein AQUCO_02700204v1 [Aquilegia coerulea]
MVDITISRARWTESRSKLKKDTIRPLITLSEPNPYYMVSLRIGTPGIQFYLMFDTGSHLTWVQAHDCIRCFYIENGSFNSEQSTSFTYLDCEHPLCQKMCNIDHFCVYEQYYGDNVHGGTRGFIVKDDMTFDSDTLGEEKLKMIFGIGLDNVIHLGEYNQIAGIFGLGPGRFSFLSQLPPSLRRFSYCLPRYSSITSWIKFGNSVDVPPNDIKVQTIPIINGQWYLLNCIGISVNGNYIRLSKDAFTSLTTKFFIDTGAPLTTLVPDVYIRLTNVLKDYFKQFKLMRKTYNNSPYQNLCYFFQPDDFDSFPDITFHFQGANYTLQTQGAFNIEEDLFCLGIQSGKGLTLNMFGAKSQANHCFIHDINKQELTFYPI